MRLISLLFLSFFMWGSLAAQRETYAPRFWQNWSLTLAGGVQQSAAYSPTASLLRPMGELDLAKQLTPAFSLGLSADFLKGTDQVLPLRTRFNRTTAHLMFGVNLMNLFAGFPGRVRRFEVEVRIGGGWGHCFSDVVTIPDDDFLSGKAQLAFNVNVGRNGAWTIGFRPSLSAQLHSLSRKDEGSPGLERMDLATTLGITYHFGNGHGGHRPAAVTGFAPIQPQPPIPPVDPSLQNVESLSAEERARLAATDRLTQALDEARAVEARLRTQLAAAQRADSLRQREEHPDASAAVERRIQEVFISFEAGSATIASSQFAQVERLAMLLRQHPRARLLVSGYASQDGGAKVNLRLARQRAAAVKSLLVAAYAVRPDRVTTQGVGRVRLFSDPEWNRVCLCQVMLGE